MEKDFLLTAKEAKTMAAEHYSEEVIFRMIREKAKDGRFNLQLNTPVLPVSIKDKLIDFGYSVRENCKFNTTVIEW